MSKKIGVGMSASYCSLRKSLDAYKTLTNDNDDLIPIMSDHVFKEDSRFMKSKDVVSELLDITKKENVITSIHEAELLGPKNPLDIMVVLPCTANTLAKIANGICDNALTMAIKATLRNQKPVVIGLFSNDALGNSSENIAKLLKIKNIYFIPFGQDDPVHKPNSMVCDPKLLNETIEYALSGKQIQPIIRSPL